MHTISIHVFNEGNTMSRVVHNSGSKTLREFAPRLTQAIEYFTDAMMFDPKVALVHINVSSNGRDYEIHIEYVRGEVRVSEYDVTPEAD